MAAFPRPNLPFQPCRHRRAPSPHLPHPPPSPNARSEWSLTTAQVVNAAGRAVQHEARTLEASVMELGGNLDQDLGVSLVGATSLFAWPMCYFR